MESAGIRLNSYGAISCKSEKLWRILSVRKVEDTV